MRLFRVIVLGIIAFLAIGCSVLAVNKEKDAGHVIAATAATAEESTEVGTSDSSIANRAGWGSALKPVASVADYGAIGDGVIDDTEAIQKAINSDRPIYFPSGVYAISRPIVITNKENWSMYAQDASFLYTGKEYAFRILSAQNCRLEIGHIKSIEGGGIEFYSDSTKSWNQYISLTFNFIESKTDCIHVEVKNGGWSTENRIYGGRFAAGKNGVHILHPGEDYTNGWKFYDCGIEGVTNGFLFNAGQGYINDIAIINPRYEESYETILKTEGQVLNCLWIGTSVFKAEEIECSTQTTRFEVIAPIGEDWHRGCIINGNLMAEKTKYESVK